MKLSIEKMLNFFELLIQRKGRTYQALLAYEWVGRDNASWCIERSMVVHHDVVVVVVVVVMTASDS